MNEVAYIKIVVDQLDQALASARQVPHGDMLIYLIEMALVEAREDYFSRLPTWHPDYRPPRRR